MWTQSTQFRHIFNISFNIILTYGLTSSQSPLPVSTLHKNSECISVLSHPRHMPKHPVCENMFITIIFTPVNLKLLFCYGHIVVSRITCGSHSKLFLQVLTVIIFFLSLCLHMAVALGTGWSGDWCRDLLINTPSHSFYSFYRLFFNIVETWRWPIKAETCSFIFRI